MNSDKLSINNTDSNWYAIAVIPGHEYLMKKKLLNLAQTYNITIDTFIPAKSPKNNKALLPGIILLSAQESWIDKLIETPGVKGFYNNTKSEISEDELNFFKNSVNKKIVNSTITINQLIVINKGTFSGLLFKVESIDNENMSGFINLFGRETLVSLPKEDLI